MNKIKLFLISLFLFTHSLIDMTAQAQGITSNMQEALGYALKLINSFKNDSAKIVLNTLITQLEDSQNLHTTFGMNVRLRQAEVLEKDHQDQQAIYQLLQLVEESEASAYWDVFAEAHLSLARLYEKLGQSEKCHSSLKQAELAINQHQLNTIYPLFAIRIASYHRIFSGKTDSALFYARAVLRTVPKQPLHIDEGTGHMLLALLLYKTAPEESAFHFTKGGQIFKALEDFTGYGAMLMGLSTLYLRQNKPQLALIYNDSAIVATKKAAEMGNEQTHLRSTPLRDRASIFKALGNLDSSWLYLNQSHQIEMQAMQTTQNEKIIEVEARYKDEQKNQRIQEQEKQLQIEQERRLWIVVALLMMLGFVFLLSYYNLRLRKINRVIQTQAQEIEKTNQELSVSLHQQLILQGEVHHRVKNNLQTIISLLELQSEGIKEEQVLKSFESMSNRIFSMAAIHEMLYLDQNTEAINLLAYTQNLCKHFQSFLHEPNKLLFKIDMEQSSFNLATLMPLGMILNELMTNSIKYAASKVAQLEVHISLIAHMDGYCLIYRDNGPGFSTGTLQERKGGLGTYLIKSMSRQLNGHLTSRNDAGAVLEIFFKEKNKKPN